MIGFAAAQSVRGVTLPRCAALGDARRGEQFDELLVVGRPVVRGEELVVARHETDVAEDPAAGPAGSAVATGREVASGSDGRLVGIQEHDDLVLTVREGGTDAGLEVRAFKGLGAALACLSDALEHADCLGGGRRHVRGEEHVVVRIEGDQWV